MRVGEHVLGIQSVGAPEHDFVLRPGNQGAALGGSIATRGLRAAVARMAPTASPTLVRGERRGQGAGRLRGAPSFGADGRVRPFDGLFGAADGGTLFLDDIGETSVTAQARLLRALADGEVRLGVDLASESEE